MKKLKTLLQCDFLYLAISISLLNLSRRFYILIIIYFIYLYLIRKKRFFKSSILISILFLIPISFIKEKVVLNDTKITANVIKVFDNYSILKDKETFIIYDTSYRVGDIIYLEGNFKEIESPDILYVYSFEKNLNNQGIYYYFNYSKIDLIGHKFNYRIFNYELKKYIEKNYERSDYYKALILSENDIANESINNLGIAHMLCISGLHINLIILFLKKLKIKDKYIVIPLFIYLILLDFKIAVLRVFLTLLLSLIFKLDKINSLSLSFIILLFINPNYIYQTGFILTYLVTISFMLTKKYKLIVANLISIPFTVSFIGKLNILSILFNFLFSYVFKYILIPLTFICFFIKPLDFIYTYFIESFEYFVDILDTNYLLFSVCAFNKLEYLLYYLTLFSFLIKNKIYYYFYLIYHLTKGFYVLAPTVIFFDVTQGDSCLIVSNEAKVMVDCYKSSYQYLVKRGIKELDYLFLTHSHNDHVGGVSDLLRNVKVKNIVISYYDEFFYYDIKALAGDSFSVGNFKFDILGPFRNSSNLNNISLVIKFKFLDKTILLTGDMESEYEKELCKYYKFELKSDILKVGHHGSITSSSEEFLYYVKPTYSVISVGNNYYGHPDDVVLERLSNTTIYQTNKTGSVYLTGIKTAMFIDL